MEAVPSEIIVKYISILCNQPCLFSSIKLFKPFNRDCAPLSCILCVLGFKQCLIRGYQQELQEVQGLILRRVNNMRNLKFKAQPTNAFFATVNQMFGSSSQLPTAAEHAVIKSLCIVQTTKQCSAVVVSWRERPKI